jgi:hypothetical protein
MMHYIFWVFFSLFMNDNKTIRIAENTWTPLETERFFHATNGAEAAYPTIVKLKADDKFLTVAFRCEQDVFVDENDMVGHNEPLYNQEVFEVFIAAGTADPVHYIEVEINPNNATWVGKITNPSLGKKSNNKTQLIDYEASGIQHAVEKGDGAWSGVLSIPWKLISDAKQTRYRINFYRIVSKKSHPNRNWVCETGSCDFLCWNATLSGAAPAFHRPKRFGTLAIAD